MLGLRRGQGELGAAPRNGPQKRARSEAARALPEQWSPRGSFPQSGTGLPPRCPRPLRQSWQDGGDDDDRGDDDGRAGEEEAPAPSLLRYCYRWLCRRSAVPGVASYSRGRADPDPDPRTTLINDAQRSLITEAVEDGGALAVISIILLTCSVETTHATTTCPHTNPKPSRIPKVFQTAGTESKEKNYLSSRPLGRRKKRCC